jgi:hypothetical protein
MILSRCMFMTFCRMSNYLIEYVFSDPWKHMHDKKTFRFMIDVINLSLQTSIWLFVRKDTVMTNLFIMSLLHHYFRTRYHNNISESVRICSSGIQMLIDLISIFVLTHDQL